MNKEKILVGISNVGETLVVIGAIVWITGWHMAEYLFVAGTLLFAIGRFFESHPQSHNITLKRLYTQRAVGIVFLIAAMLLMLFHSQVNGLTISDYQVRSTSSAWLLPFMIFVVIEVYTAFRIPSEQNKERQKQ